MVSVASVWYPTISRVRRADKGSNRSARIMRRSALRDYGVVVGPQKSCCFCFTRCGIMLPRYWPAAFSLPTYVRRALKNLTLLFDKLDIDIRSLHQPLKETIAAYVLWSICNSEQWKAITQFLALGILFLPRIDLEIGCCWPPYPWLLSRFYPQYSASVLKLLSLSVCPSWLSG